MNGEEAEKDRQKGSGGIIIAIVNFFFGGILFALGVEAVREFCVGYETQAAAYGAVGMGVLFVLAGLPALICLFLGFFLSVRGDGHRFLALAATCFLLLSWLLLPLSGTLAGYYYNAAAPYVRVSEERAVSLAARYGAVLSDVAEAQGDAVCFYDGDGEESAVFLTERDAQAVILPAAGEGDGDGAGEAPPAGEEEDADRITFSLSYDPTWRRLTAAAECIVPFADGRVEKAALARPLAYVNALSSREFSAEEAARTAETEEYADHAWDGYAGQVCMFDPFVRIESEFILEEDGVVYFVRFRFFLLTDTSLPDGKIV